VNSQFMELGSPLEPRPPGCPIPLTAMQARMWSGSLQADGSRPSLRLCASAVRLMGTLNVTLLQRSIEIVIRRHEALRTRIVMKGGCPYQQIEPVAGYVLRTIDLSDQPPDARSDVSHLVQEFIETPVDLVTGPLFEAMVWRLSDDDHILVLLIDHIVSDGMSNGIIAREVWECYRQGLLGQPEPASLPQVPVQFADYAVWQAQTRLPWIEKHAEYWRQNLRGAVPTVIPADLRVSGVLAASGITVHIPFGDELTAALREAARRERCLLSIFVLAAYAVVISAWCRTDDLLLIFPSHGRHHSALRNVVGCVANMLLLRIKVKRERMFSELVAQVKYVVSTALAHRDFDRLPDLLPEYTTELSFNWQPTHSKKGAVDHFVMFECADQLSPTFELGLTTQVERAQLTTQLRVIPFPARTPGLAKFQPVFFDTPSGIHVTVMFDPNIIVPVTVESFGRRMLAIAREVCEESTQRIVSLLGKISSV